MDVSSILSKSSDLPDGITVKPDMLIQEQLTERLLMKERWTLIQSGVNKKILKLNHPPYACEVRNMLRYQIQL